MNATTFSIIIATYNSGNTLPRTLDSLLNQTYKNFEVILIDGKSMDNTIEIIEKYQPLFQSQHIDYKYISEPDKGIYDAMNKGILLAKNQIIGITNSDDYLEADTLEQVKHNISDFDYLYGNISTFNQKNEKKVLKPKNSYYNIKEFTIFHPALFIKSYVYKSIGLYKTQYKIASDYELYLRLYQSKFKGKYLDKTLANFYLGGTSNTNYIQSFQEAHQVRIENGYHFWASYFFMISNIILVSFKRIWQ